MLWPIVRSNVKCMLVLCLTSDWSNIYYFTHQYQMKCNCGAHIWTRYTYFQRKGIRQQAISLYKIFSGVSRVSTIHNIFQNKTRMIICITCMYMCTLMIK